MPESADKAAAVCRARAAYARKRRLQDETVVAVQSPSWLKFRARPRAADRSDPAAKKRFAHDLRSTFW